MTLNTDYRTPVEVTGAARAALEALAPALPLQRVLPDKQVPTLNFSFDSSGKQQIDLAEYRNFDTEAPYGRTAGRVEKTGKIPPISRKLPISEFTELSMYGDQDAIGAKVDDYAANLARGVAFRVELARAEVLRTGKLKLHENNLQANIDFGRKGSHTVTLSGASKWSAEDATPIDDIETWQGILRADGQVATSALVTLDVLVALSKNKQIIELSTVRASDNATRISLEAVRAVLAQFGLSDVTVVDTAYSGLDLGRPVFPAGSVVLLPTLGGFVEGESTLGETQWGIPAEAVQPQYGIGDGERPGLVGAVYANEDPIGLDVLVSSIVLPVLTGANSTLYASVL